MTIWFILHLKLILFTSVLFKEDFVVTKLVMSGVVAISASKPFYMYVCGNVVATGCSSQILQNVNAIYHQDNRKYKF